MRERRVRGGKQKSPPPFFGHWDGSGMRETGAKKSLERQKNWVDLTVR